MSKNVYDQGSRYLVGIDPVGFTCWLLGLLVKEFSFVTWLDTRAILFPGERDRTGDMVAHLLDEQGKPWAILLEFQVEPDPEMFGRVLRHLGSIWQYAWPDAKRGSRFNVGAIVVNLTGHGKCSQQMNWQRAKLRTALEVVEINLAHERAEALLQGVEAGLWPRSSLPFVPLMAGGDDLAIISRWVAAALAEPNAFRRSDYAAIALIFAERAGRKSFWDDKLKGWNVTESPYLNQFIAQGEAKGEAKGRAEGEVKGRTATLLEVLAEKFLALPGILEDEIRQTTDLTRLRSWTAAAVKANTLEEFRSATGL